MLRLCEVFSRNVASFRALFGDSLPFFFFERVRNEPERISKLIIESLPGNWQTLLKIFGTALRWKKDTWTEDLIGCFDGILLLLISRFLRFMVECVVDAGERSNAITDDSHFYCVVGRLEGRSVGGHFALVAASRRRRQLRQRHVEPVRRLLLRS